VKHEVVLTNEQYDLFLRCLKEEKGIQKFSQRAVLRFNNAENLEETSNMVSSYFLNTGLDKEYEPTELGHKIEELHNEFLGVLCKINDTKDC